MPAMTGMGQVWGHMSSEEIQDTFGDAGVRLLANNCDIGVLRPWVGRDGRNYYAKQVFNQKTGKFEQKTFLTNTPATLSYDAWKLFDSTIIRVIHERLKFVSDVRSRGLTFTLPNGMAHTVLQYQTQSDISRATVSMDPTRKSEGDRPETDIASLPLPLIHKDFDFTLREIMASRLGNMPLDTTTAELAAIKVAEEAERMAVGEEGSTAFKYAGASVYGLITFLQRSTKTDMTVPTGGNGATVITDILTLRQMLIDNNHRGPYMMYVNSQWSQVLDTDFSSAKGDNTLRQRILALPDIEDIQTLDFLPTTRWHMILVEMKSSTVRMVVGVEAQVIQWESAGGMRKHWKILTQIVPQFRPDTAGNSGIAHGRTQ